MKLRRKKLRGLAFIVMIFVLMISSAVPSLAETFEKDGVEVTITTDKESYSTGEEVLVNVMVRNIGAESISNIKIELQVPDGVTLAEGIGRTVSIETLLAGEEKTAVVTAKAEEHFDVGDNGSNGNISGSVQTGDTQNPVIYIVMLSLAVAMVVGLAFTERKNNKAAKIISAVVITLVGVTAAIQISYAATVNGSFEVSKTIKVDGQEKIVTAVVTYNINPTEPTNPTEATESTNPTEPTEPENPTEPTEPEINEPTTATAEVTGTAYPDKDSEVSVTFTADNPLTSNSVIKINDMVVSANSVVDMMTVSSITYSGNTCTVSLRMSAINGSDSVNGSYDVELMNGSALLASQNVSYSLDLAPDTDYTVLWPSTNSRIKAYYKVVGTKMYVMTVLKEEIHSAGITVGGKSYMWYDGVCSQLYMTIDGTKYGLGSYVNNAAYANSIDYALDQKSDVNHQLINSTNATRSFMALGTFDDDTDTDTGCILLNIVDLSDVGYNADDLRGKEISFSGYMGPNDHSARYETITTGKTFTIKN